ncbi:hypothetical protein [Streptomyces sp. Je 1-369]|uniref:hypothetical protein n=1 Tax=Streptomyces sp. Je 1-369 TaxID=2966192 RepID=UPI00228623B2|nr:hypothetical protein [Streptomyces sp. Je 1-369]WAL93023.1 hypothetical protein NOO62_00020 [Streptomyces sp. Je 1-369]WAL99957.1 hypothetical protein NOO62_39105 [Streptomyces sp. Je 1-369]
MDTQQTYNVVFDWLARAQAAPQQARREWTERGFALLPLGRRFNSVYLPGPLVHVAAGTSDLEIVTRMLAELLDGPVIHNRPQNQYYALVERTPVPPWTAKYPEAPMLGSGQYLSVPASDLTGPTGLHWAVRPRIAGDLCAVPSVAALICMARDPRWSGAR